MLNDEYFDWLYKQISNQRNGYKKLCYELHAKPFLWSVPNDDNRCEDGINLRFDFLDTIDLKIGPRARNEFTSSKCTVLEVLIAIAKRIEFLMDDLNSSTNHTSRWFFLMLRNLDLSRFTDDLGGFEPREIFEIDRVLERFINRTYDWNGNGSLFPRKRRPVQNMAQTEIWYQLMGWMDENYDR